MRFWNDLACQPFGVGLRPMATKHSQPWNALPTPSRQPRPGELLFEFVRASDRSPMRCELRFHGESFGWEVQFFDRRGFLCGRGSFVTRAAAVRWAEQERDAQQDFSS